MKNISALTDLLDDQAHNVLALATSAMLLFFASFVWLLIDATNANAQDAESCGGTDLIAQYAVENPDLLVKIEKEANSTLNSKGVLWKIEKEGIAPSYLLGTMHLADSRIAKLEGAVKQAFDASNIVLVENIEALDPIQASAAMLEHKDLTLYTDGSTLEDRLDAETIEGLRVATEARGMPFGVTKIMQPWLVAASIALPICEMNAKNSGKPVLDGLIVEKAKEANKELVGLETIGEQFNAIAGMPESFHLKALEETLALGDTVTDLMETMKLLYIRGDIGLIHPLTKSLSPDTADNEDYKKFEELLIVHRNGVMAERAIKYLEKGWAFIAVGALHLPDEEGLVEKFREAGFTLTLAD